MPRRIARRRRRRSSRTLRERPWGTEVPKPRTVDRWEPLGFVRVIPWRLQFGVLTWKPICELTPEPQRAGLMATEQAVRQRIRRKAPPDFEGGA